MSQPFAERLQDIPAENIRIVGTATLRTATNAGEFIAKANQILGHPIDVISGEEEAATIYKGVAHTSGGLGRRLVVDIGGASTELIIGEGFEAKALTSLKMGCVTWLERHFKDRQLTATNFNNAILAAKQMLDPILTQYTELGWNVCVGASGTVQALQEIMLAQGMDEVITLTKLKRLQKQAMLADHLEELDIEGLTLERALVFPSGLSILIAIFESLNIEAMTLAGGALREVSSMRWFKTYAKKIFERAPFAVYKPVISLIALMVIKSPLSPVNCSRNVAVKRGSMNHKQRCCCVQQLSCMKLVSPSISKRGEHSAYLLQHLDLPGYTRAQKHYLGEIVRRYREQLTSLPEQYALSGTSGKRVLRLLRLAVLLSHRRSPALEPMVELSAQEDKLTLTLDGEWLAKNPLTRTELELEANRQTDIGWPLSIECH